MSSSPLPPLYDRWITELVGAELAGEPEATCLDCAMLAVAPGLDAFDPATKCCTYTPALPNYLVGAALADERLDEVGGRRSLRDRIARRAGVTPIGLDRGRLTSMIAARARTAFGQAPSLRCPHYHADSGKCGVWLHRNAVCSTWFCKHERGAVGMAYWHALRDLLVVAEQDLARWCVLQLGAPYVAPAEAEALSAADLAGTVTDADYARQWGDWLGRESELYADCHRLVGELSWGDVVTIAGPELGLRMRALERASQRKDDTVVPAALVLRKLQILRHGEHTVLASYNGSDPLAVPPVLVDVLPLFRGQPTREARDEIARDADLDLEDDLLVRLVDFGILADADEP